MTKAKFIGYMSSATFSASQSLLFVMYPILAERMGLSISQVVLCFTIGSFLFLWGGPYWALRSDTDGRGRALQWGQAGVVLSLVGLGLILSPLMAWNASVSFALLLLSRVIYGVLGSGVVPVAQALIIDESPIELRTKAVTTHSMILNSGRLLGPIFGLTLAVFSPLLLVLMPLGIFIVLMVLAKRDIPNKMSIQRQSFRLNTIWPDSREARVILILAFLATGILGIYQSSLGAYLQHAYGYTPLEASQRMAKLLIAGALTTVCVQFTIRTRLSNPWQGSLPIGVLCLLISSATLLFAQGQAALYGAILLMSAGIALLTPSYTSAMSLLFKGEQGKAAGALSAAHTLGYSAGGLLAALGLKANTDMPFVIAFGLGLGALIVLHPVYQGRNPLNLAKANEESMP